MNYTKEFKKLFVWSLGLWVMLTLGLIVDSKLAIIIAFGMQSVVLAVCAIVIAALETKEDKPNA